MKDIRHTCPGTHLRECSSKRNSSAAVPVDKERVLSSPSDWHTMDEVNNFMFPFFQQELPDDVQQPVWMKNLVAVIINAVRILHAAFQSKWEKAAHFEEGNNCIMWKVLSSILPTTIAVRSENGAALSGFSRKACTGFELFAASEKTLSIMTMTTTTTTTTMSSTFTRCRSRRKLTQYRLQLKTTCAKDSQSLKK